jgi:hypothetical protein
VLAAPHYLAIALGPYGHSCCIATVRSCSFTEELIPQKPIWKSLNINVLSIVLLTECVGHLAVGNQRCAGLTRAQKPIHLPLKNICLVIVFMCRRVVKITRFETKTE